MGVTRHARAARTLPQHSSSVRGRARARRCCGRSPLTAQRHRRTSAALAAVRAQPAPRRELSRVVVLACARDGRLVSEISAAISAAILAAMTAVVAAAAAAQRSRAVRCSARARCRDGGGSRARPVSIGLDWWHFAPAVRRSAAVLALDRCQSDRIGGTLRTCGASLYSMLYFFFDTRVGEFDAARCSL